MSARAWRRRRNKHLFWERACGCSIRPMRKGGLLHTMCWEHGLD